MKRFLILTLVTFLFVTTNGTVFAQEKEIDGFVGWVTLDRKTLVLVKDGVYLGDFELDPNVTVDLNNNDADMSYVLSGRQVKVVYSEEGGTKIAKKISISAKMANEKIVGPIFKMSKKAINVKGKKEEVEIRVHNERTKITIGKGGFGDLKEGMDISVIYGQRKGRREAKLITLPGKGGDEEKELLMQTADEGGDDD